MSSVPLRVCLLFRKKDIFFSIERIFSQLMPALDRGAAILTWEAPYTSPRHLLSNIRSVRRQQADVYHITGDIHYMVWGLPRRKVVLTIHDCVFLYAHSGIRRRLLKWLFLDMPVRRSRIVTTISEQTKKDIIQHTGCAADKIIVIPNPADDNILHVPAVFRADEPVILFIGSTPNKNLPRVIAALEDIPCRLEVVGKIGVEMEETLRLSRIRHRVRSGLTDAEMIAAYATADMVLFPSTFEGFGLPIVEGQKTGRPVITSDLSPMKEVAGGAACLVDPYSISAIRDGVLRIIRDKGYREQLVRDGLRNAARFDAGHIAQQYLDCYHRILKD
jgi:glycosyltransferase involved in cell wall biosynthesis